MREVPISFVPTSGKPEKPQTGGARLINAIVEQLEDGRLLIKRAPGLRRLFQSLGGFEHCRGLIAANTGTLLVVYDGHVESVTKSGANYTVEDRGALAGTDLVTLARNNAATPQIVGVSPANGAFVLSATGAPGAYPDADVGVPNSVSFLDGSFIFTYGDGRFRFSDLNSTAIDPTNELVAESHSDGLLRGVTFRGQFLACGPFSIEFYQNDQSGGTLPYSRVHVMDRGIASTNSIAGWEDGFVDQLIWATGDNMVCQLRGYDAHRISTPTIERDLQALTDKTTLRAFVAMHRGHAYWVLKSQTFTHVFDLLNSVWQERHSYGIDRFRGEQSVNMFGDWIIGDELSGDVFALDADIYLENDNPLVFEVESATTEAFPTKRGVKRADFNIVSDALPEIEASVLVYWSENGGTDWKVPLERDLARSGRYDDVVTVKRTGHMGPHGRKWKLLVSDPVYVGLLGGKMFLGD